LFKEKNQDERQTYQRIGVVQTDIVGSSHALPVVRRILRMDGLRIVHGISVPDRITGNNRLCNSHCVTVDFHFTAILPFHLSYRHTHKNLRIKQINTLTQNKTILSKMKKTSILCIILAAAVVLLCAKLALNNSKSQATQDNVTNIEDATYNSIMTRTSIRKFQDKAIESDKIEKMLRAGMAAPTAVNKQPWHFVVITDADIMKNVSRQGAGAPLGIAVCGDMDKALEGEARDFWVQDVSAATENILLAAHAMGLGAVWTGVYPIANRCAQVAEVLQLPENIIPLNIIIIGYPAEEPAVKDKWNTANISYNVYGGKR